MGTLMIGSVECLQSKEEYNISTLSCVDMLSSDSLLIICSFE